MTYIYLKFNLFLEEERSIRPSKSDTSLTDGFVVIDGDKLRNEQNLRKGFKTSL